LGELVGFYYYYQYVLYRGDIESYVVDFVEYIDYGSGDYKQLLLLVLSLDS